MLSRGCVKRKEINFGLKIYHSSIQQYHPRKILAKELYFKLIRGNKLCLISRRLCRNSYVEHSISKDKILLTRYG